MNNIKNICIIIDHEGCIVEMYNESDDLERSFNVNRKCGKVLGINSNYLEERLIYLIRSADIIRNMITQWKKRYTIKEIQIDGSEDILDDFTDFLLDQAEPLSSPKRNIQKKNKKSHEIKSSGILNSSFNGVKGTKVEEDNINIDKDFIKVNINNG